MTEKDKLESSDLMPDIGTLNSRPYLWNMTRKMEENGRKHEGRRNIHKNGTDPEEWEFKINYSEE